jgi:ribose/xylose/arabinose/galactoside ABC-type transport system permease subunit
MADIILTDVLHARFLNFDTIIDTLDLVLAVPIPIVVAILVILATPAILAILVIPATLATLATMATGVMAVVMVTTTNHRPTVHHSFPSFVEALRQLKVSFYLDIE